MAHLLIMGASSGIGLATVKEALEQGHTVRAFARSALGMTVSNRNLEKFAGDALIQDDVARALEGVDAVLQTLGVPVNKQLLTGPITLFSEATSLLLQGMDKAGVTRLLTVTGFGAGRSGAAIGRLQRVGFDAVFRHAYGDKSQQEAMIEESATDWTIVRPGVLTNGPKTKHYHILQSPDSWRNGIISRANVAHFLVDNVDQPDSYLTAPVIQQIRFPSF